MRVALARVVVWGEPEPAQAVLDGRGEDPRALGVCDERSRAAGPQGSESECRNFKPKFKYSSGHGGGDPI